ncbi:MAG: selenium metabolism-associated LysR family transcriptional regulator [Deltaproteobacteria bacterium]
MAYDTFKNITIQQLESLFHLVAEKNFSLAAKKMVLTQPSLSKHIKNLEEAVGTRLVNREGTGVSLTPEGKLLFEFARKVIYLREDVKDRMLRLQDSSSGSIRISASTLPATYILPYILSRFRKSYPQIRTFVQSTNSEDAIDMVLHQQSEIGFIGKNPRSRKLHSEPLWQDRLILAVPAYHHWSGADTVSVKDILEAPFVMREKGSATREILGIFLSEHAGIDLNQLNIVAEMGGSEAVKEAVIAGLGISVLSLHAVKREIDQGIIVEIPIQGWRIVRQVYLIYRHQLGIMRHHQMFLDYVRVCRASALGGKRDDPSFLSF